MGVMKKDETAKGVAGLTVALWCDGESVIRRERWNAYYEKKLEKMRWKGLMCDKREQQRV